MTMQLNKVGSEESVASSISSREGSFHSARSNSPWYDNKCQETSPLLQRAAHGSPRSSSSVEAFQSCQLPQVTDLAQTSTHGYYSSQGETVEESHTKSTSVLCMAKLTRKHIEEPLCGCHGKFGFSCLSSLSVIKPYLLFFIALGFSVMLAVKEAHSTNGQFAAVSRQSPIYIAMKSPGVLVKLTGPFFSQDKGGQKSRHNVTIFTKCGDTSEMKNPKNIAITLGWMNELSSAPVNVKYTFMGEEGRSCQVNISATTDQTVPLTYTVAHLPMAAAFQSWLAFIILCMVYLLIILDLTHRATAAMLGALGAIATLTLLNKGPSLEEVATWLCEDIDTLSLLFGMMIIVSVLGDTGFFSYIALKAFRFSKGKMWYLITALCFIAAVVSAFLDNVTTVLLMTPVTIRLCEVSNLDPVYVLIAEVLFANIGGTATAIGDLPNVIIVGNKALLHKGVAFGNLTLHLAVGILLCIIFAYITIRILYHWKRLENVDPPEVEELRREADIWQRTASRLCVGSPEEKTVKILLLQKSMSIRNIVARHMYRKPMEETYNDLSKKYQVTEFGLLVKTVMIVTMVIALLFIQILDDVHLKIGWIPVLGALLLILLADIQQLERIIEGVEWTTLIFFASLFILMRGVSELGLIETVGSKAQELIRTVGEGNRLMVAIVTIIWISAIASSFIDNVPLTSAMIPVVLKLADDPTLKLPIKPMVYALAFGTCLGGNGTLIGASTSLVASGLAEQQGYQMSFNRFFKIGFPVMLVTVLIAMSYLLVSHVALQWNT